MDIDAARRVADTVLHGETVLSPYRASAFRGLSRWQFGVLMPADVAAADPSQPATAQTECVLEAGARFRLRLLLRFLQVQRRTAYRWLPDRGRFRPVGALDVDGTPVTSSDEAVGHEVSLDVDDGSLRHAVRVPGGFAREELRDSRGELVGQLVRHRRPLCATLDVSVSVLPGPRPALRLRVWVENRSRAGTGSREVALTTALVATHVILGIEGGAFVSMVDPPEWAVDAVECCANVGLYPVLAGPPGRRDTLLATPIVLDDHPGCGGTGEADEVLLLRTLAAG